MGNVEFENRQYERGSMGPRGLEDYGSEGLQLIKEKLTLHYPPSSTPYRTMQKDAEGRQGSHGRWLAERCRNFRGISAWRREKVLCRSAPVISTRRLTYIRGRLTRMIYLMSQQHRYSPSECCLQQWSLYLGCTQIMQGRYRLSLNQKDYAGRNSVNRRIWQIKLFKEQLKVLTSAIVLGRLFQRNNKYLRQLNNFLF